MKIRIHNWPCVELCRTESWFGWNIVFGMLLFHRPNAASYAFELKHVCKKSRITFIPPPPPSIVSNRIRKRCTILYLLHGKLCVCRRTDGERVDPATVPVGRVVHAATVVDGGSPVVDNGGADRVRTGERVHAVVAVRVLGAGRSTARAQGRRRRGRGHGGHRQAVHRQGDAEPAGSTATAIAATAETGGGTGARQVRREEPPAGVPIAAHPVHGRVPVDAVPDGFGRRLVLRQLQSDQRGTVRQQNIGVPRHRRRPPARRFDGPRGRRNVRGRRRPVAGRARGQMNVSVLLL